MSKPDTVESAGGSSVDDMIRRMEAFAGMSGEQRSQFISSATKRAGKAKLSESDWAMMMGADGYFQDEDGNFD